MLGRYICFEGVNGSGKSTVATAVVEELSAAGHRPCPITFPSDRTPVGTLLRSYLRGEMDLQNPQAMLYLYTADTHLADPWVRASLAIGAHVVADRHASISGRVYQLEHHTSEHIEKIYSTTTTQIPDDLFIIDVPVEVAVARMTSRTKYEAKHYETKEFSLIEKHRQRYLDLAETAVARGLVHRCHVLDGTKPLGALAFEAFALTGLKHRRR